MGRCQSTRDLDLFGATNPANVLLSRASSRQAAELRIGQYDVLARLVAVDSETSLEEN